MDTKQKEYGESTGQGSDDDLGPRSVLPSKAKWSEYPLRPHRTRVPDPEGAAMDMQLNQRRQPTGTYCGGNHPELIEYRYTLVDGAVVPHDQSGPRCFRAGCPDNQAAKAKEQRVGRSTPDAEGR